MAKQSSKAQSNPIVLRTGINIGANAAEDDDELLFSCFEDNGVYADLANMASPRYLLKGRTGSGKTAFLRHLERNHPERVIRIDPQFLCLRYISNSDIMRYLAACDVDVEPFFQIIWRHAFCTELLKRRYKIESAEKAVGLIEKLSIKLQPNKKRAIDYLNKFGPDLWPDLETRITEIAKKVEANIGAEIGGDFGLFNSKASATAAVTTEEKAEVQRRVNRVLCSEQLADLGSVISFLADNVFDDEQHQYYVVIDDLDQFVVDDSIRYLLLRALIDSIKKFKGVKRVKFCVAVRSDLLELIFDRTRGPGFQTEKYEDSILEIRWTKEQLFRLAEKRIAEVFKRQYTQRTVGFDDVFPNQIDKKSAREYIFERTLRRPRDLIAFVNQCFSTASDRGGVSTKLLREAEGLYSDKRQAALVEEWSDAHPLASLYFPPLQKQKAVTTPKIFAGKDIDDLTMALCANASVEQDPLGKVAQGYYNNSLNEFEMIQAWLAVMYKFGVVGVKTAPQAPMRWAMSDAPAVVPNTISPDCGIEIHPMMYRALAVAPRQAAQAA